ncbi:hypothetical protein ACIBO2_32385 [Nonomuraea sp. NPDC050022]|uniref:hypothetical protein n=1 Tax=Nonomuraea sp. NPDC050022 TaxID=3364358 RepID=UPI00379A1D27
MRDVEAEQQVAELVADLGGDPFGDHLLCLLLVEQVEPHVRRGVAHLDPAVGLKGDHRGDRVDRRQVGNVQLDRHRDLAVLAVRERGGDLHTPRLRPVVPPLAGEPAGLGGAGDVFQGHHHRLRTAAPSGLDGSVGQRQSRLHVGAPAGGRHRPRLVPVAGRRDGDAFTAPRQGVVQGDRHDLAEEHPARHQQRRVHPRGNRVGQRERRLAVALLVVLRGDEQQHPSGVVRVALVALRGQLEVAGGGEVGAVGGVVERAQGVPVAGGVVAQEAEEIRAEQGACRVRHAEPGEEVLAVLDPQDDVGLLADFPLHLGEGHRTGDRVAVSLGDPLGGDDVGRGGVGDDDADDPGEDRNREQRRLRVLFGVEGDQRVVEYDVVELDRVVPDDRDAARHRGQVAPGAQVQHELALEQLVHLVRGQGVHHVPALRHSLASQPGEDLVAARSRAHDVANLS